MHRNYLHSLVVKLILLIGGIMLVVGLVLTYLFMRQNPEISLMEVLPYGILFIAALSALLCIVLYQVIMRPLALLVDGMNRLSKGELDYRIQAAGKDEIGMLAESFNAIAEQLKRDREKMDFWTKSLEDEVQRKTTEIVRAQDQLINAEKLASLGRMAAGVAHEINNPLTGIITFAHLMLKRTPPEKKDDIEDLAVIIQQAERCSKIIKGLLGFSRKAVAEKRSVSINELIENTLTMVKNQTKFYNIIFDIRLDRSLPEIVVDPNQIQQVFLNLLLNAADALEEKGTITIASRVIVERNSRLIELEFTDTGPGIPEEILGKIFEPFYTTKPTGKGTGLGLAVSYGIIRKHGGQIFVKTAPGKGASFFIRLPMSSE